MQFGGICKKCPGVDRCKDKPTSASPISMECMRCSGGGCSECGRTGNIEFINCPLEIVKAEVWDMLEYAKLYGRGLPPVHGGALDQAQNFLAACNFIFSEQAYWKAKLGIIE